MGTGLEHMTEWKTQTRSCSRVRLVCVTRPEQAEPETADGRAVAGAGGGAGGGAWGVTAVGMRFPSELVGMFHNRVW